jgi:hypothetical protein
MSNIKADVVQHGQKTVYRFHVVATEGPNKGQVTEAFNTADRATAQKWLEQKKAEDAASLASDPGSSPGTVNGEPLATSDPLSDGSLDPVDLTQYDPQQGPGLLEDPSSNITSEESRLSNPNAYAAAGPREGKKPIKKSALYKRARDYCNLGDDDKKTIQQATPQQKERWGGVLGGKRLQAMTKRLTLPSENIIGRGWDNNAFIVIGNDRSGGPHTSYGGKGHTQCDSIDLVAGLGGFCPSGDDPATITQPNGESVQIGGAGAETNPNFFVDSARIYISQKTDVDKNFGIGEEFTKGNSNDKKEIGKYGAKSAVVAKADNIRLIGRESLRLVTGTDEFNSQGGLISGKHGIELVAMNKVNDLQPLVLGDNLVQCLSKIIREIESVAGIFQAYVHYQMKFNKAVMSHNHISPFFAIPNLPSAQAVAGGIQSDIETLTNTELSIIKHVTNLKGTIGNYLVDSGDAYINSRQNKSN